MDLPQGRKALLCMLTLLHEPYATVLRENGPKFLLYIDIFQQVADLQPGTSSALGSCPNASIYIRKSLCTETSNPYDSGNPSSTLKLL